MDVCPVEQNHLFLTLFLFLWVSLIFLFFLMLIYLIFLGIRKKYILYYSIYIMYSVNDDVFLFSQIWSFVLSSLVLESISSFCKLPAAEPIHLILLDRPGLKLGMSWASCAGRYFFTTGKGPVAVCHPEQQYWERKEKRHSQRWDSEKLLFYNISQHFRGNCQNRQSLGQNTVQSV